MGWHAGATRGRSGGAPWLAPSKRGNRLEVRERTLQWLVAVVLIVFLGCPLVAASQQPAYYPSGVLLNVPESEVGGGWTICYDQPYSHATTYADLAACQGAGVTHVLMGAKASAGATTLALLAAGRASHALAQTSSTTVAYEENGAYWYKYPGASVGFAESSEIYLGAVDQVNRVGAAPDACSQRLSWHVNNNNGGWRAGCTEALNSDSTWRKVLYSWITDPETNAPSAAPTESPTTAPTESPTTNVPTESPTTAPTESPTTNVPTAATTSTVCCSKLWSNPVFWCYVKRRYQITNRAEVIRKPEICNFSC